MLPNYLKKHICILSTWLQCTDRSSITISLNCRWLVNSIWAKKKKKHNKVLWTKELLKTKYALSIPIGIFYKNGQAILLQLIMSIETNIRLTTKDHQYQVLFPSALVKTPTAIYFPLSNLRYLHRKWCPHLESLYSTNLKTSSHSLKKKI